MTGRLEGRAALITGAGSGIGRAAAELFAAEGAVVAVVDLRVTAARETVDKIASTGGRGLALGADVTSAEQITDAVVRAVAEFGGLDVVYNNAGVDSRGSVAESTEADWDRCFAVNAKGTFLCTQAAIPYLRKSSGGV